jgi:hypothetical protein
METPPQNEKTSSMSPIAIGGSVVSILFSIIVAYGAAKLSYDKYGSFGWALLAFIFAPVYYVYYVRWRTYVLIRD